MQQQLIIVLKIVAAANDFCVAGFLFEMQLIWLLVLWKITILADLKLQKDSKGQQ